jgi:hypothetical protein
MRDQDDPPGRPDLTELYRTAAQNDCGYLLDFHCHNLFGHKRPGRLTPSQRAELATAVHNDFQARPLTPAGQAGPIERRGFSCADAFVEPQPIAHVASGLAGDAAQFLYKTWLRNRGVVFADRELTRLCPFLLLTLPEAAPGDVPHITFVGTQSALVKFFPQTLDAEGYGSPAECLPQDYRQGVSEGYQWASNGEPSFDIQRTGFLLGEGVPDMTLQRLLLRFETKSGFARIFALVTLLEMHSRPFKSNRADAKRWRKDGLSWHPAYQVKGRAAEEAKD